MTAITVPMRTSEAGHLRPLNVIHDLPAVADLVELCFYGTLGSEGQRYVQQMRRAGRDTSFLRWAANTAETVSMPLSGYVWEENGRIVGNVSLIPFRRGGRRIYLIANVAVHPDFRRHGIARALTERVMLHARQRGAESLWLHVRADNEDATALYTDLGFRERDHRTAWQAMPDPFIPAPDPQILISSRHAHFWSQQRAWLERLYPPELAWYQPLPWEALRPGGMGWLYRLFIEMDVRQWAALKDGRLQGVVSWLPGRGQADPLWVAFAPDSDEHALTTLLLHARRHLGHRRVLSVEIPAGQAVEALTAAGFKVQRTLIWMQADGATG